MSEFYKSRSFISSEKKVALSQIAFEDEEEVYIDYHIRCLISMANFYAENVEKALKEDNYTVSLSNSGQCSGVDNAQLSSDEEQLFKFLIPSDMCGLFIGTKGRTIKKLCKDSGTKIELNSNPFHSDYQICTINGTPSAIGRATDIIKTRFPSIQFLDIKANSSINYVIMPHIVQLALPENVSVGVRVSSIVDAGRIFVQLPTHPTFPYLSQLQMIMNQCYMQDVPAPGVAILPFTSGLICAAPMLNGWNRAQIMETYEETDESIIKYLDYGGYSRLPNTSLNQIRSDFLTLPFQAVECYLANITHLPNEQYFSIEAFAVLEKLTICKLLCANVVGRAEDGIPYVHLYQLQADNSVSLVNAEMVHSGVVGMLYQ